MNKKSANNSKSWLPYLLTFLNADVAKLIRQGGDMTMDQRRFRLLLHLSGSHPATDHLLSLQKTLRDEIAGVLDSNGDVIARLETLLRKIDHMGLRSDRYVRPINEIKEPERVSVVIELTKRHFAIVEWEDDLNQLSPERSFYRILDSAIRSGEFSRVRLCHHCKKFFLLTDPRAEYCSSDCRIDFHKKTRTESGYFAKKMKESRAKIAEEKKQRERESKEKTFMKSFQAFIDKASSRKTADQMAVYPTVKLLGGWNKVSPWCGKQAADVWKSLDGTTKKEIRLALEV